MSKKIITVTGYSCSGKSTLINRMEQLCNCDIMQFGMIHKECVKNNGYLYAKDWIKEEGFSAYEKELLVLFKNKLKEMLKDNSRLLMIDGIFSSKCFQLIRSLENVELTNIVLNTDYNVRIDRMMERQKLGHEEAVQHMYNTDSIKQNAGLQHILRDFDYMIDGNRSKEQIEEKCLVVVQGLANIRGIRREQRKRTIKERE